MGLHLVDELTKKHDVVIYDNLEPQVHKNIEPLKKREWEMKCPSCGKDVKPVPTDENKPLQPTSIYAISKKDREDTDETT